MQPLVKDAEGVIRFKANAIVEYLLANGGIDLNQLAAMDFSQEDREQFAQLIGYSLTGFGELRYVSDEAFAVAATMSETEKPELESRIEYLCTELEALRTALRNPMARLFGVHPDDLKKSTGRGE